MFLLRDYRKSLIICICNLQLYITLNILIMKKRNLKSLNLNKKSVSKLNSQIKGGATYRASCGCQSDTCNETFTCRLYGCADQ